MRKTQAMRIGLCLLLATLVFTLPAWTQEVTASWECDVPTLLPISLPLMSVIGVLATALSSWGRAMLLRSLFCYTGP